MNDNREIQIVKDTYCEGFNVKILSDIGWHVIYLSAKELTKLRDRINQALPPPS